MNILLWTLQILLALHTIAGAVWKFSNSEAAASLKAIPHKVWLAMSVIELLCGLCLIIPVFSKKLGILAPAAAIYIALEMLIFCAVQMYSGEANGKQITYWIIVAVICAFIAYGRLILKPF
jgi:hypothetical protein